MIMRRIHKLINSKRRKAKRSSTSAQRSKIDEFRKRILEESQKRYNVPYGVEVRYSPAFSRKEIRPENY